MFRANQSDVIFNTGHNSRGAFGDGTDQDRNVYSGVKLPAGISISQDVCITTPLKFQSLNLPIAVVNQAYSGSVLVDQDDPNNSTDITYTATDLPDGLALNSSTGEITGTPTAEGNFNSIITATDNSNPSSLTQAVIHIRVYKGAQNLYTWGLNNQGVLGLSSSNTELSELNPKRVGNGQWITVSGGNRHYLAIDQNGDLYAWGDSGYGQLGFGGTDDYSSPQQVIIKDSNGDNLNPQPKWTKVIAMYNQSFAMTSDYRWYSWGSNEDGQLGSKDNLVFDDPPLRLSPGLISIPGEIIETIAPGPSHTFARAVSGNLYFWGSNEYGLKGDGTSGTSPVVEIPVLVGSQKWFDIVSGSYDVFATDMDGKLWAWGINSAGSSGIASASGPIKIPTLLAQGSLPTVDWRSSENILYAGKYLAVALVDGDLYGWGENANQNIFLGSTQNQTSPWKFLSDKKWSQVHFSGTNSIIFAQDEQGKQYSWGKDRSYSSKSIGLLGYGSVEVSLFQPTERLALDGFLFNEFTSTTYSFAALGNTLPKITDYNLPIGIEGQSYSGSITATGGSGSFTYTATDLPGGLSIDSGTGAISGTFDNTVKPGDYPFTVTANSGDFSATGYFTLTVAASESRSLNGWGDNSRNLIGDSTVIGNPVTSPLLIDKQKQWVSVFSSDKSAYGIDADGKLYAWGDNSNGRLGTGNTTSVTSPTHVLTDNTFLQVAPSAGRFTLALSKDGKLFAFGNNSNGQLGDGTTTSRTTPIELSAPNGEPWTAVSVGRVHSMGLTSSGALYTWGSNSIGQIGDGGSTDDLRPNPVRIMPEKVWVKIQASELSSFAVDKDGKLYAWGSNSEGILGDGSSTDRSVPTEAVKINELNKNLAAGSAQLVPGYRQMVLVVDGELYTWGGNTFGELGNGTTTSSLIPIEITIPDVKTGETWVRASAGNSFTHGLTSEGRLFGWGTNTAGSIGDGFKTVTSYDFNYNLVIDEDQERLTPVQIGKSFNWSKTSSHYYDGYSTFALGVEVISLPKELEITQRTGNKLVPTISNMLSNKNVVWSSSNEDLATVDEDGKLTVLASCLDGVTITATTVEGGFSASTELLVTTCLLAGEGTSASPYLIGSALEVTAIGSCGCGLDATYQLTADITMPTVVEGESNFTPIGTFDNPFTGVLDGNEKTITGIRINVSDYSLVGMFGVVAGNAIIEDLTLNDHFIRVEGKFTDPHGVASLVGLIPSGNILLKSIHVQNADIQADRGNVGGIIGSILNRGESSNIKLDDVHFAGSLEGSRSRIGGLVANYNINSQFKEKYYLEILGSSVEADLIAINENGVKFDQLGGFVGYSNGKGEIKSSSFDGTIEGEEQIGGGVGESFFLIMDDVSVSGTINGTNNFVGGLIGQGRDFTQIKNSSISGLNITGLRYVGGLAGEFTGSSTDPSGTFIENVSLSGITIQSLTPTSGNLFGGLIGRLGSYTVVQKAKVGADVSITAPGALEVGGMIGRAQSNSKIYESVTMANVDGDKYVGGFIGTIGDEGTTEFGSTYAAGAVKGNDYVGGYVGSFGWEFSDTKGVVIKDSYSISPVDYGQATNYGGFVGGINIVTPEAGWWNNNSPVPYVVEFQVLNSYYDKEVNAEMPGEEEYGKSTKDMQLIATYQDAEPAWDIDRADFDVLGTAYPVLRWTTQENNKAVWLIAKNAGDFTIEAIKDQAYTGAEIKPEPVVKDDTEELTKDVDYTVDSYSENVALGTATVTLKGKGKYTGETTATFEIVEKQLTIESQKLELSKEYEGTTSAKIEDIVLSGVVAGEEVTVTAVATYDTEVSGMGKTITVVYTLGGKDKGNYLAPEDFVDKTAEITKKRLTVTSQNLTESKTYDGLTSAAIRDVVLTGFAQGEDVQVSAIATYDDEKAGTGKTITVVYTIEGKDADNYSAPVDFESKTGEIKAKDLSDLILGSKEEIFSGSGLKPSVTVKEGDITLEEGVDYEITYTDNINTGTATVTVTGKGNYSGTLSGTFAITVRSLGNAEIEQVADQVFTGSALTPALTVKDGTLTLKEGTDFTAAYSNNINVGTAAVTVTGIGNYAGTLDGTFAITARSIGNAEIEQVADQVYTGSALTPALTVKDATVTLKEGTDFTAAYSNNVNVGTAAVTVTGIGNYAGTLDGTFAITASSIGNAAIEKLADQVFTGSALTPALTVKDGTVTLKEGTDFTAAYSNNINVGTAAVTVTGIGNYAGTLSSTFEIESKSLEDADIVEFASMTYTGSALEPTVTVKDGSVTLEEGRDFTVTYSDNINAGTATVTVEGIGNYAGSITSSFTIDKHQVTVIAADAERNFGEENPVLTFSYEGLLNDDKRIAVEPVISTAATSASQPGTYPIVLTGGSDPNYAITLVSGVLTVIDPYISPVTGLVGETGDSSVELIWGLPEEFGSEIMGYLVEISEDGLDFTELEDTDKLTLKVEDLMNMQKYWFRVKAYTEFTIGDEKVIGPLVPTAPATDEDENIPVQEPGEFSFQVDGKEESVNVEIINDALVFDGGGLNMQLSASRSTGDQLPILEGLLLLSPEGVAQVNGKGFRKNTEAGVWLIENVSNDPNGRIRYELPYVQHRLVDTGDEWVRQSRLMEERPGAVYFLGTAEVDAKGEFTGSYDIPEDIKPGRYTLQATGITTAGATMSLNLGAILMDDLDLDSDGDLVPDVYEFMQGTDPDNIDEYRDSNGDGVADYVRERSPVEFFTPGAVQFAWGQGVSISELPKEVVVTNGFGQLVVLGVNWDISSVDVFSRGSYEVSGELVIPAGMFNAYGIEAAVEVVILPKAAPQDVELISPEFRADGSRLFYDVSGLRVIDPVDNIHELSLLGEGFDNRFFEIRQNILFWSSGDHAPGRTEFTVHVLVRDRDGNEIDRLLTVKRERSPLGQLEIYNTFTPNGDGQNDSWGVPELRFFDRVDIQVMERSGQRVFSTDNPDRRWDGTYNGKELPVGTYYWIIEVKETGEVRRGMLNLLRK
jgi:gliding motility-associated-like protein